MKRLLFSQFLCSDTLINCRHQEINKVLNITGSQLQQVSVRRNFGRNEKRMSESDEFICFLLPYFRPIVSAFPLDWNICII